MSSDYRVEFSRRVNSCSFLWAMCFCDAVIMLQRAGRCMASIIIFLHFLDGMETAVERMAKARASAETWQALA
jgi:hypothetical protein